MSERITPDTHLLPFSTEEPLLILPTLATAVGLEGAIILQYLHGLTAGQPPLGSEPPWILINTRALHTIFPFWDAETLQRAIASLEFRGLLIIDRPFRRAPGATCYQICYDRLQALLDAHNREGNV